MSELSMLEGVLAFLLVLPLLTPFFSKLSPIRGLFLLPPIGLAIAAGLFPAYGFRLEGIPLQVFALVETVCYWPTTLRVLQNRGEPPAPGRPFYCGAAVAALAVAAGFALFFAASAEGLRWWGS